MKVTDVLLERGWSQNGWEDHGKVCIMHAVDLALLTTDIRWDRTSGQLVRQAIYEVALSPPLLIGAWNDYEASYEDVMLVAKLIDERLGL